MNSGGLYEGAPFLARPRTMLAAAESVSSTEDILRSAEVDKSEGAGCLLDCIKRQQLNSVGA